MEILRNIKVPTGNILIVQGEYGPLEVLSLGDYGRQANVHARFLGLDRLIDGVPNGETMPLTKKWVITLSTQYGCSSRCKFCDVPKVGQGRNATWTDIMGQIKAALSLHPEVTHTDRLNIHYARMGEPSWNPAVLEVSRNLPMLLEYRLGDSVIHPVFTTMCPKGNQNLKRSISQWLEIKNTVYDGEAGLQLSINSTAERQRDEMFGSSARSLKEISEIVKAAPRPHGRKIALNFALADNYEVDAKKLRKLFNPETCMVKITPLHKTRSCVENGIETTHGYDSFVPYEAAEDALCAEGFDVLVFVPSKDEDEGRITCGNAILSGSEPFHVGDAS